MANQFFTQRLAKANFTPTTADTYTSAVVVPEGAILKKVTTYENTALAGGTNVTFQVGAQDITAAIATAAFTGTDEHALTNAAGLAVTSSGYVSITTTGTFTGDIDVYIEYYV